MAFVQNGRCSDADISRTLAAACIEALQSVLAIEN
jgi:hypothetical protein